jgi:BlaI family transcriptional regulator, penicillinase repressor
MDENLYNKLSKRERQIIDIIFQLGEATAVDIQERLPDAPGNSSIRVMLRILEAKKGYITHREEKGRFIYRLAVEPEKTKNSALGHVLQTFFGGSIPRVVSTLLSTNDLSKEELDELARLIDEARKEEQ